MAPRSSNIQGTLHVDRYLTNFSVGFVQSRSNFLAQRATSVIPIVNQSDKFVTYDRGYFWRDEAKPRPLGGRPEQVGYKVGEGSYSCTEYALEHVIDDRQRANVDDPIRLDEQASNLLTQKMMIKQDRIWAQKFFISGAWSTQVTGTSSPTPSATGFLKFTNAASNPIAVMDLWRDRMNEKTGFMPNTLVLGVAVARSLRLHPDITDRIKYTQIGVAEESLLASLFKVTNLVIARGVYNAAQEGATDNFDFIVDENAMWLGYIDPNPGLDSPTAIATFAWTNLIPGLTNALGGVMERGRDERAHSDWFQSRMAFDLQLISADLGVFFSAAV